MAPPLTRREFLQALVIAPAVPILPAIDLPAVGRVSRWHGIEHKTILLDESSILFTGEGVWSEWAVDQGAYDQPLEVFARLTQKERNYLHLRRGDGCIRYNGSWENGGLDELASRMIELELPWYLSDDWRWIGDWFDTGWFGL